MNLCFKYRLESESLANSAKCIFRNIFRHSPLSGIWPWNTDSTPLWWWNWPVLRQPSTVSGLKSLFWSRLLLAGPWSSHSVRTEDCPFCRRRSWNWHCWWGQSSPVWWQSCRLLLSRIKVSWDNLLVDDKQIKNFLVWSMKS